jgi:uncharacterized phage infection (PIP) family protein YhgE
MKKIIYLFPLLFVGFLSSCNLDTPENASKYYKSIVEDKTNPLISKYEPELIESFKEFKPDVMSSKYKSLEDYVNKIDKELSEMEPYHGDATLIDGANKIVDAYKKALPLYKKKVEIESLSNAEYTDANANESNELMNEIDELLNDVTSDFQKITSDFGKNHNFTIEKK